VNEVYGEEDDGGRARRVWEKLMSEDAASEKSVAIGSVGWELFSIEKEVGMREMVDSSDDEEEAETPFDKDAWEKAAKKKIVAKDDWVKVESGKKTQEIIFKEKGFKDKTFVNQNKYNMNLNPVKEIKSWETKNQFEKLKSESTIEAQMKTELNFGNMMKTRSSKSMTQMKTKLKTKESETDLICQDCKPVDFSMSNKKPERKEINVVENVNKGKVRRKGKVTVDSGAEDSVWPATHVDWDKVVETEESRKGICFVAANGGRMNNYGAPKSSSSRMVNGSR